LKYYHENTLVIGDTHEPFTKPGYLEFCFDVGRRCKCGTVVHIGDLVDNHSISYHEHDPDGKSPKEEFQLARARLKKWFKAFPNAFLCRGNHDCLVDRKGKTAGLPAEVFRPFRDIWELPKEWVDGWEFEFQGVLYTHGTGYSGKHSHVHVAYDMRKSSVIGHIHSVGAVQYLDTGKFPIFGMNVGCGIDREAYAFAYGKDFKFKPIISCGVVTDHGRFAQVFPMS